MEKLIQFTLFLQTKSYTVYSTTLISFYHIQVDLKFGFEAPRRDAILRTLIRNSFSFHLNEILATVTNEYIDWEK